MERHGSFPTEIAIAGLVVLGLLLLGSNIRSEDFRSPPPDLKSFDPQSRAEVKAQYAKLVEDRKARRIARDGAPEKATVQPAKH